MTEANSNSYKVRITFFCVEKFSEKIPVEQAKEEILKRYQDVDVATDFSYTFEYNEEKKVFEGEAHMNRLKGLVKTQENLANLAQKIQEENSSLKEENNTLKQKNLELEYTTRDLNYSVKSMNSKIEQQRNEFGDPKTLFQRLSDAETKDLLYKQLEQNHTDLKTQINDYKEYKNLFREVTEKYQMLEKRLSETQDELSRLEASKRDQETETKVWKRSLVLSYKKYASLSSRKLLNLLSEIIFEAHSKNSQSKSTLPKCDYPQDQLISQRTNKCDDYACLEHFLTCPLSMSNSYGSFDEILPVNTLLNRFAHDIRNLTEIVISADEQQEILCAEALNKIINYLRANFSDKELVKKLPESVLLMSSLKSLEELACYKIARDQIAKDI